MATVNGTSGKDFIHVAGDGRVAPSGYTDNPGATNGDDIINPGAGSDMIFAGGGDDTINFASGQQDGTDTIDGGSGNDTVNINSTVSSGNFLHMVNVENVDVTGSHIGLLLLPGDLLKGQNLTIDTSGMDVGGDVVVEIEGSGRALGHYTFVGPAQAASTVEFQGGDAVNVYDIAAPTVQFLLIGGSTGNDTVTLAADPGQSQFAILQMSSGDNVLNLDGGLSPTHFNFVSSRPPSDIQLANFARINLGAGFDYTFQSQEQLTTFGQALFVNGDAVGAGNTVNFNVGTDIAGNLTIYGGAGNDTLVGAMANDVVRGHDGNDIIDMSSGGNDNAQGGTGSDRILFGATLTIADHVDGGGGGDNLVLAGDYDLALDGSFVTRIDTITLGTGHNYTLSASDDVIARHHSMTVDGSTLGAADVLRYDGSAETDGSMTLLGGAGADVLIGGAGNDTFVGGVGNDTIDLSAGGSDTAEGDAGNDLFKVGGAFSGSDQIDGGNGNDTIDFDGDYASQVTYLRAANFINVETLRFEAGHSYAFNSADGNVAAGHILTVDGSALGSSDALFFNGGSETDGRFTMLGGAGNDRFVGGSGNDSFTGGLGGDTMTGGAGRNVFNYASVAESTSSGYDTLGAFNILGQDRIHLPFLPTAVDTAVTTGTLSKATFDADMAAAIGAGQLGVGHAVLFTADSGDLATHHFLIVDANGTAGYQAGQDYVIQLGNGSDLTITTATFR